MSAAAFGDDLAARWYATQHEQDDANWHRLKREWAERDATTTSRLWFRYAFNLSAHPTWRRGQTYFNTLVEVRLDLAERIRGTRLDPFHDDDRLRDCVPWVEDNWAGAA